MDYALDALIWRDVEPFHGKSRQEGIVFLSDVTSNLGLRKELFSSDRAKIDYAVQYLKGDAALVWDSAPNTKEMTFKEFKEFIENVHLEMNPFRLVDLACEWDKARQREGQSVRSFSRYLFSLEFEMGNHYTKEQKARHLLAKLRETTRLDVIKYAPVLPDMLSQEIIVSTATRIEALEAGRKERELEESKESLPPEPSSTSKRRSRGKRRGRGSSS